MTATAEAEASPRVVPGYRPYVKRHSFPAVRCGFWLLAWANGCPYRCAYCWLRSYHPWPWEEVHVAEKAEISRVLRRFASRTGGGTLLNAGELCDSMVQPRLLAYMVRLLQALNRQYGRRHRILALTKSADLGPLLDGEFQDVLVYSASVNAEDPAALLEMGAPHPALRVQALRAVRGRGYETRVRVDPIIPGYPAEYALLVERLCTRAEPARITLGCLRATARTLRTLPARLRAELTERTPWGRGLPLETRLRIYAQLLDGARAHGVEVGLCKEPPDVWRALRLAGRCNCQG